jgi:hypothetical protein
MNKDVEKRDVKQQNLMCIKIKLIEQHQNKTYNIIK